MTDSVEDPTASANSETPVGAEVPQRVPQRPMVRLARPTREERRWSGLPIAASLALVAFTIVLGIYGPRIVDRGSPSVGTPLWEVVDLVVEHFDTFVAHSAFRSSDSIDQASASAGLKDMLRSPFTCPDLTAMDFAPTEPQMLRLPSASRSAVVIFARSAKDGMEYLCLAVAPYTEQYTMFSEFGKPELLSPGGAISVDAAPSNQVHPSALIWTDGAFLYVAVGSRRTTLADVTPALAPSMAVGAR